MRFLIDANLPYYFSLWHAANFTHVYEIDSGMSDEAIWEHAKRQDLTIVTKDADFSDRIMLDAPPPRVIHLRIGNMTISELHDFLSRNWARIEELSMSHKLVSVGRERIDCVV